MTLIPDEDDPEDSVKVAEPTWDTLRARCTTTKGLSDLERIDCEWAIDRTSQIFPSAILSLKHPVGRLLANGAPWTLHWLRVLVNEILRVEPAHGWNSLRSRLSRHDTAAEAVSVLRVAANLVEAGLRVSFDVPTMVHDHERVPDIQIENPDCGDILYAEVSQLGPSVDQVLERDQFHRLALSLIGQVPGVLFAGRITRTLSAAHFTEIERRIAETVARASAHARIEELSVPDVIHLGVAPLAQGNTFTLWRERHGFSEFGLSAPTVTIDHFKRLKLKAQKEAQQLPDGLPNLLVVWSQEIVNGSSDLSLTFSQLEEITFDLPNVSALVLAGSARILAPPVHENVRQNRFVRVVHSDFVGEEYFVVPNRFCISKIAPATLTRLLAAFA